MVLNCEYAAVISLCVPSVAVISLCVPSEIFHFGLMSQK